MSKTLKDFLHLIDEWIYKQNDVLFQKKLFELDINIISSGFRT